MTEKMTEAQFQELLEAALKRSAHAPQADEAAVERVLKRLSGPLPRQKMPYWRWPAVLLDWQFAPAWPRVAALAGCAALGFFIGIAGLDRRFDAPGAQYATANRSDLGWIVFEPETMSGARP